MSEIPEDENETTPEAPKGVEGEEFEQQTLREIIRARQISFEEDKKKAAKDEAKKRRDDSAKAAEERKASEAKKTRSERLQQFAESRQRIQGHIGTASSSLREALREASALRIPRYSPEGVAHARLLRSLDDALNSLRRVGRSNAIPLSDDIEIDVT